MVPAEATTAKTSGCPASTARSAVPVRWSRSSSGTVTMSTSSALAALWMDECAVVVQASCQPPAGRPPRRVFAISRAVISADMLPEVPPETKQPPAVSGQPSIPVIQASASFSAKIAPAPASQSPPKMFAALVTRSKATAARVGAAGM